MNREGNTLKTRGLWKHPALFLMLLLVLLLCIPAGSAFATKKVDIPVIGTIEDFEPYDDENWSYQLNNVKWDFPFNMRSFDVGLDLEDGDDGDVYAEVRLISKFDFDITIKKPNFTADDVVKLMDPDSDAVNNNLYRRTLLDSSGLMSLVGFVPYVSNVTDMAIYKNLVGGANVPCRIQGKMEVYCRFKASFKDFVKKLLKSIGQGDIPDYPAEEPDSYHTTFTITSVEPLDPDYDGLIYAYVGDEEKAIGGFGVISLKIKDVGIKVGPIIDCNMNMMGWDLITARKHFDEWNVESITGRSSVHSCTEEGKDGCVSWTESVGARKKHNWKVQIKAKVFGLKLIDIHHKMGEGSETTISETTGHHKSLTFDGEAGDSEVCDHMYYPVPVYVWADEEMRQPVSGAAVSTVKEIKADSNMKPYTAGVTDSEGITTLWLPYSNVRYALTAASGNGRGYGVMPTDMQEGENDPVNIVLKEGIPEVLSSYTVEFYYQKDGVYPDEPDRSEKRGGLIGDLAFLTEEDLEPDQEQYELDNLKSAIHYGVVQEDGSLVLKVYFKPWYLLTYNLNGGSLNGSTSPVVQKCNWGDKVTIQWYPEREGFRFLTWLGGKEYEPGESYTVTGDHIFTAVWESGNLYKIIYAIGLKYDEEESLNHINLRLFNSQGEIEHWSAVNTVLSDTEIMETIYFTTNDDYYFTVEAEDGYTVNIKNTGSWEGVADRCYNGGIITVQKVSATPTPTARPVPKTGDNAMPVLWVVLIVTGLAGVGAVTAVRRRK